MAIYSSCLVAVLHEGRAKKANGKQKRQKNQQSTPRRKQSWRFSQSSERDSGIFPPPGCSGRCNYRMVCGAAERGRDPWSAFPAHYALRLSRLSLPIPSTRSRTDFRKPMGPLAERARARGKEGKGFARCREV